VDQLKEGVDEGVGVAEGLSGSPVLKGPVFKNHSTTKTAPAAMSSVMSAIVQPQSLTRRCFFRFRSSQVSLEHVSMPMREWEAQERTSV
jgi:hypothetical protein